MSPWQTLAPRRTGRESWYTLHADKVRLGSRIRVFSGGQAVWARVEDRQIQRDSITFTTGYGDYTYYRGTRMVVKQD